jgi:hypothetical protein
MCRSAGEILTNSAAAALRGAGGHCFAILFCDYSVRCLNGVRRRIARDSLSG